MKEGEQLEEPRWEVAIEGYSYFLIAGDPDEVEWEDVEWTRVL